MDSIEVDRITPREYTSEEKQSMRMMSWKATTLKCWVEKAEPEKNDKQLLREVEGERENCVTEDQGEEVL